ncbi:MAG: ATP-grasp domain-containing protein, partial [Desulfonatronovibrio sp.]|nr:ATP-grasp domain-containing protein [Desulfovibrionales bacterium]
MRVLLIAGGWSNERQVSLNGAAEIEKALHSLGHEVVLFDLQPDLSLLIKATENCDTAFINLHGNPGEDGLVQALLEDIKFPYQGSGPVGSFLSLNKNLSKQIYRNHGLPTPDWYMLSPGKKDILDKLPFPCIAKPNSGGSSLGLEILNNKHELEYFLENTSIPRHEIMLEEFIPGIELTCTVLDNQTLPPILIKPKKSSYFDYASKYDPDGAQEICPAPVPQELSKELSRLSIEAHQS